MPDQPTTAHAAHDLELVARAATGDLAATEVRVARDRLATCPDCAALADDLRAIVAATRDLPRAADRAAAGRVAPRDFRIGPADAARLRRPRLAELARPGRWFRGVPRAFGGALATLGLVGLLVTAGWPALGGLAGAAGTPASQQLGAPKEDVATLPPFGPLATDAAIALMSGDPDRTAQPVREETPPALPPQATAVIVSIAAIALGLAIFVSGRHGRRTGS